MQWNTTKNGFVYLVGAGPGDPGLITVKGQQCIAAADVIIYDYLANDYLLRHAKPGSELIYAGKVGGMHNQEQGQINDLLIAKALEGKVVTRLKGGDPFIFGRGGEECEALIAAGVEFEVVPGVTAGIGASAYAGIPLTHRNVTTSVAFVTGHEHPGKEVSEVDWSRLSLGGGTIVFYMGMKNLAEIAARLVDHGRSPRTPVALIRWGTRPEQEVLVGTLADVAEKAKAAGFKPPAITVVGEVVNLREQLRWFDNRPLFGKGIMVTRAADQAGEFAAQLVRHGAHVYECPTIELVPVQDHAELDEAVGQLGHFDWLVLTSANAVRFFFARLTALGRDSRAIGACRVCAVGPKTAEAFGKFGVTPDLVPSDYKGEGVVAALKELVPAGKRVLFPRADRAREVIPAGLRESGIEVVDPVLYRNVIPGDMPPHIQAALEEKRIHCVTFTSSSTVTNLAAMVGENRLLHLLQGVKIAAIGPITAQTCREVGLEVHMEPGQYTVAALTQELIDHFTRQG